MAGQWIDTAPRPHPTERNPALTRFVAIGECMVELAPQGDGDGYRLSFAGDTFNTAWYAKRLRPDWDVGFATAVGQDAMSGKMMQFLAAAGIDTTHVQRRTDRTVGLYMIELEGAERHFSYWRGQAAARLLAEDAAVFAHCLAGADILYFSGITLAVQEGAGRQTLLDELSKARASGAMVVFDPNLRPRLWSGADEMRDWITRAAQVSDVILPSHEDEAVHFGDASPQATLARYLDAGATTVVVKNGGGDIHFVRDGVEGMLRPDPVTDIVDTTAAGDSFNAGFLAALQAGGEMADSIRAGARLAARVIQGRGALVDPGT